jgi:hypothetical protein
MSRTVDGTFGLTKNQPPTVTRPFDFGTDAIERQRVSLGQSIIDADFEYGLQATKWQTYQEVRKFPSFYEIPGTDIQVTSVTTDAATPSLITVNINTALTTVPNTLLALGSVISIVGLANPQRNADRAEGFFIVRTVTGTTQVSAIQFEARGIVNGTTISTSYTVLRRGGVYTNGTAYLPFTTATADNASPNSVITVSYPPGTPHGLIAGTPIQTSNTAILAGFGTPETVLGNFIITSTPTANTFTFSAVGQTTGSGQTNGTNGFRIYTSPYSYAVHRPFDGGVLLSPGQPSFGSSSLRQSKKVFRYQSGKGLLWSSGTLFCPNNDVTFANVVGSTIQIVCDVPHGSPQAGATIQLKGITTPGYNGTYTVSSIVDSRTLRVTPTTLPTVSPAVLGDQPRFIMSGWYGATVRAGCFEDQNGLFWEWDGQTLWAIKRSSTFQVAGYVTATVGSQVINGDTSDTSLYLNSTINMGTAVAAVTSVNGTYTAGSSTSNVNVTVTAKTGTLNPGLLFPVSAIGGISPGAASVVPAGSTYTALTGGTSGGATLTLTATPQGPLVQGTTTGATTFATTVFPNLGAGGIPYVSTATYPSTFTVTFPSAPTPTITNTNIVGSNGTISATTGSTTHYLTVGSQVNIAGVTPSTFNGTYTVASVPSSTTYTVAGTATGTYVQVSQTAVNPTTATITTAVPHGLSNAPSVTTTNTGFSFANGSGLTATVVSPTVVSIPATATVPGSGTAVYTLNGTFSNALITTTSSAFSISRSDSVSTVTGTYPGGTAGTAFVLSNITGANGTFIEGQSIDSAAFGATAGTTGYISTVTSQTNITVTFGSSITPKLTGTITNAPIAVSTVSGTYSAGAATVIVLSSITGASGTFVLGQAVDSSAFGATAGTTGHITTVTNQTNITVTFASSITAVGTSMTNQTFYNPYMSAQTFAAPANVTGVGGSYSAGAATVIVLSSITGAVGRFVVGLAVNSSAFGATAGTTGYITAVTSQTNITVTFPVSITAVGTSMTAQTFYKPFIVTVPNTFQSGTQFTVANATGGSGVNVTGAYTSPTGLSGTAFQYSTATATAVPTSGTITISPYFVQVTTPHGFTNSTFSSTAVTVTGGDASYAKSSGNYVVISPTVVQYVTAAAPTGTVPVSPTAFLTATYTATTPFFSAGVGDAANFIASGLNLATGTYSNFAVGGTNAGYTQKSSTTVTVTNATTVNYVVAPSTSAGTSPLLTSTITAPGTSQVNFLAGSITSNVVTVPPSTGTKVTTTASWVATTNSTTVALTGLGSTLQSSIGWSVPVAAFGGNGGYAYVSAAGSSTTATVTFSQAQTLSAGSGASVVFNPSPTTTASDLCDLAYATLAPTTSNNATASTGSFVANFVVPQTFAAGSFSSQTLSLGLNAAAQIMPFVADPIPIGTSNLLVVAQTNTVSASSGLLNNGMQTATASFLSVFGSNAYVTYSNALSNAFVINFPPLGTSITKAQVTGLASQLFVYPNTRFVDQLRVNDKVTIRGMTHTVVQIQTQGTMIVNPPYRGVGNITTPVKMCKIKEVRTPQSQFNRDTLDGTGPSGFKFDPTKMQMIGLQYTWYGAGFVDFMMRGGDGNWVYAHRYKQNNINDEAYMRTGNMPVRYELVNESVASSSALAAPTGLTDTTLTLTEAPTYWPPSGNVLVDNEFMTYTGKSGVTLTGVTRFASMVYNVNDQNYTLTASAAAQTHQAGSTALLVGTTCTPSLTHWGSAFIMDGQFDSDRGYFFNYSNVMTTTLTAPGSNVFMIRLAPSVSNGIVGDMGQRDLLSRAQLLLQKLEVIPTGGTVNVTGILNPSWSTPPTLQWSNVNSTALGSQPSFTQVSVLGSTGATYVGGSGERIFSTIAPAAAQNTIDLSALKELSNTVIGGNGIFPDGPDTLMIQLTPLTGTVSAVITNLFWTEAQA